MNLDMIMQSDKVSSGLKEHLLVSSESSDFAFSEISVLVVFAFPVADAEEKILEVPEILRVPFEDQRKKRKYMLPEAQATVETSLNPGQIQDLLSSDLVERIEKGEQMQYFHADNYGAGGMRERIREQFMDGSGSAAPSTESVNAGDSDKEQGGEDQG